jgi:hypothetical protein
MPEFPVNDQRLDDVIDYWIDQIVIRPRCKDGVFTPYPDMFEDMEKVERWVREWSGCQ